MSKRVYEIARERSLDSKEVIKRLREAGVEVNHHSATIEDPVYERVFGDGQNGQADAPTDTPADDVEPTPAEPTVATVEDSFGETAGETAVRVEPGATVKDLADALGIAPAQIVKVLFSLGEMKTVTQTLSTDEIELVADEMEVEVEIGAKKITFIDTPGHEAFTEMRARGARVTDVVILVVAADDGVMPQTDEAIEHARAADVPLVVALNKIDVPNANPDRVLGQLSERELVPEAYGGETVTVPVSAKTGEGIDELLENVLIVSELEDLKANPVAQASGYVIESERDPGRGPVATLLINRGTLHKGDVVLGAPAYGGVGAMLDYPGQRIKEAGPGAPAEILGLSGVPEAGTRFEATDHERNARDKAQQAEAALRRQELAQGGPRRTLEELLGEGGVQDLNLVIKADVAGSVEALKEALARLSTDEVH